MGKNAEKTGISVENSDYHHFSMRVICDASADQELLLNRIYGILVSFDIQYKKADGQNKGKFVRYKIPVTIPKEYRLNDLYNSLGQVEGVRTIL